MILHGIAAIALALAAISGCDSPAMPAPDAAVNPYAGQEQAVYAAALRGLFDSPNYVFNLETYDFSTWNESLSEDIAMIASQLSGLSVESVASVCARNGAVHELAADMNLGAPYVLLDEAAANAIFDGPGDGWARFHAKYPTAPGIIRLTRAGFNAANDQALVYIRWQAQWLEGWGRWVLLRKIDGVWTIDQYVETLIS